MITLSLKQLLYGFVGVVVFAVLMSAMTVGLIYSKSIVKLEIELRAERAKWEQFEEIQRELEKINPKPKKGNHTISFSIYQSYQDYPVLKVFTKRDMLRLIKTESDFKEDAVSHLGAMGLMQLMPVTAKQMKIKDAYNPAQNIAGGMRYLSLLVHKYRSKELALMAYYTGETNLNSHLKRGNLPDYLHVYVRKVLL